MSDIKNEINSIIDHIDTTTMLFYQQKNESGYKELEQLLISLTHGANDILALMEKGIITFHMNDFNESLLMAMKAMECKDMILLSDILCYDIKEMLLNVMDQISDSMSIQ